MSRLILEGVRREYRARRGVVEALGPVDLTIDAGEFVCIVGPSGCGKTTLLNLVAGLERPDAGRILMDAKAIRGPSPDRLLIFQDGGLLALGGNIFNMAIVGVAVSYMVYRSVQKFARGHRWGIYAGGFLAAWLSIFVVALGVALQLAISGTSPANIAILAMGGIHAIIGIGEGLITIGALSFMLTSRPDFVEAGGEKPIRSGVVWLAGLLLAIALVIASPLASAHPDGLEWVAAQGGFLEAAREPVYNLIPDYLLPGISNQVLATMLAGVIGVLIVLIVASAIAYTQRAHQSSKSHPE